MKMKPPTAPGLRQSGHIGNYYHEIRLFHADAEKVEGRKLCCFQSRDQI